MANYDGEDIFSVIQAINEMNKNGASLTYNIVEVEAEERKGTVISSNYKASFMNVGSHIVNSVSNGR